MLGLRCAIELTEAIKKVPAMARMRPVLFSSTSVAPCTVGRTRSCAWALAAPLALVLSPLLLASSPLPSITRT